MMKKAVRMGLCALAALILLSLCACNSSVKTEGEVNIPTITWYVRSNAQKDSVAVLEKINEIAEEKIGAHLEIQWVDGASYDNKMTMLSASNAEYDLCYTADWTNNFLSNVEMGAFLDITQLLEEEAPKLRQTLPDFLFNSATVNGKIYAVPNLQGIYRQRSLAVQKKYADKYNFDVTTVKNITDIEPFLEAIKQNEPDFYPYRTNENILPFYTSKYEQIDKSGIVVKKDGSDLKAEVLYETAEWKKGMETLHQWYKKGYIRSDVNSVLDDSADTRAGKYMIWNCLNLPNTVSSYYQSLGYMTYIMPLEEPYLEMNAGASTMTAVSRTSKNPKKAVKMIELANTDVDFYNLLVFGIEGKHYTKNPDGKVKRIDNSGYFHDIAWQFGNNFNAYLTDNQADDEWTEAERMNSVANLSPISGFVLDTKEIRTEMTQIATIVKEYGALLNGSVDPTNLYNEFIEKLNISGQQKVLQEVQHQLDEWAKK